MMTLVMTLGIITTNISAIEELKVTSIVANTYVWGWTKRSEFI